MTEPEYGEPTTVLWRVRRIEEEIKELRATQARQYEELSKKLDRMTWALVTACITITVAVIVFVIQTGAPGS